MDAETGFTIEGKVYEEVTLDDLDTDERFILYDYSKLRQEDFLPEEGETDAHHERRVLDQVRHPGYWPALWHCSYRRAHPDEDFDVIRAIIGKAKFIHVMRTLDVEVEDDDIPPALTSEPTAASENGSLENENWNSPSTASPGDGSTSDSARPDSDPPPTTVLRSATSSISGQEISAA